MSELNFESAFKAIMGNRSPFPWQEALYHRFVTDKLPASCDIPTGLGKTAVIPIWLIALANRPEVVPRRLVYVVNRRTVVDQASDEAKLVRSRLSHCQGLREKLAHFCSEQNVDSAKLLAISTLRGNFADNREWSADPSRPAIIVGTVDMIGSRLLFSGYGVGFKSKPLHAGFLGQDVLLVHDEAHLEPAFQKLLDAISEEQRRCGEFGRFQVIELSATSRTGDAFGLTDADKVNEEVKKRIRAKKSIHRHEIDDATKLPEKLADLAREHKESKRAVLVFARAVEDVEKIALLLKKEKQQVETLTGTLRGKERDELVENPTFRRFLRDSDPGDETVYLVSTSAGEVGVNISADHLVCDLSTFESMSQRFGRVNRFGIRDDTRIDIVHLTKFDEGDKLAPYLEKTLNLLIRLNGNGSPEALSQLDSDERSAAFSPLPIILPTSDILFDTWALTTIKNHLPGRPPVEPYLHGVTDREPPQTYVGWRKEVGVIVDELLATYKPEDLLEVYPLKPHELLRDRSDRVFKHLVTLSERDPNARVWLIDDEGTVNCLSLGELADPKRKDRINFCTVLLDPKVGGLSGGLLNGASESADDVADEWYDDDAKPRRRLRVWDNDPPPEKMRLVRVIDTKRSEDDDVEEDEGGASAKRFWRWYVKPRSADDDGSISSVQGAVALDVHTRDVTEQVKKILKNLPLPEAMKTAIIVAASCHDLGKDREVFQRVLGNRNPAIRLAKSGGRTNESNHYRHEMGSLVDIVGRQEFEQLDEAMKDLVLHLIAAHHGRGRPHFPTNEAFDPEPKGDVGAIVAEIPRRFGRLQRKYGRWGLAYLESLLRAADYAASADPSEVVEDRS